MSNDLVEAWCQKGALLSDMDRFLDAADCFSSALSIDPGLMRAAIAKGEALLSAEEYAQSAPDV